MKLTDPEAIAALKAGKTLRRKISGVIHGISYDGDKYTSISRSYTAKGRFHNFVIDDLETDTWEVEK